MRKCTVRGGEGVGRAFPTISEETLHEIAVHDPIHPGEVLLEEFLVPLGVTQHQLALAIALPPRRINEIVHGKRRITADTALRLARIFGTGDRFWLDLRTRFDLGTHREALEGVLGDVTPLSAS